LNENAPFREADIAAGFALTGFFLERDVLEPHGMKLPSARERLLDLLSRSPRAA
jgi:DNA repair protein RecO (recombination protein O)